MAEDTFIVTEESPSGHEMSLDQYGPGSESELREKLRAAYEDVPGATWAWEVLTDEALDELFRDHVLYCQDAVTYRVERVRDHVIVVTWSELEHDIAVYGPYAPSEIDDALPRIGPDFHNSGEMPGDVVFDVRQLVKR